MYYVLSRYYPFLILFCLLGCENKSTQVLNGSTMGTTYTIKVVTENDLNSMQDESKNELERINMMMSTYIN